MLQMQKTEAFLIKWKYCVEKRCAENSMLSGELEQIEIIEAFLESLFAAKCAPRKQHCCVKEPAPAFRAS